jgi:hypothetical protein
LVMLHAPPELRASVGNQCLTAIRNGLQSLEPPYPYTREINNLIARAVEQRLDDIYKSTARNGN